MESLHHIAIPVKDVKRAVSWYTSHFDCRISYQDDTWALLDFANVKVAFVLTEQHPPHLAFVRKDAESFGELKLHRDKTLSVYIKDSEGNSVEILKQESV